MATSLENIDKSKVSAQRIEGLDDAVSTALGNVLTGAVSTITTNNLTANKVLVSNSNGKVAVSNRTSGQLEGITGYYGTCSTANSTQTKDVVCTNFVLETGASIRVKFTNNQNYNGVPKLNVNGTGAIEIKSIGTTSAGRYYWQAGEVVDFTYDGTYWLMDNGGIASTTYYGKTKLQTSSTSTSTTLALTPGSLNLLVQTMIEPYTVYSSSSTYAVGDRVRYSNSAWECSTAITTAEAWTQAHWTALPSIQEQIDNLPSGGSSRNVGEIVTSTIPLTDAGLHLLDGSLIQSGSYADFVTYIASLVSTYPDLFISEVDWQIAVTNYGVCGKFVYDSTNHTVRLPKIIGFTEGTTDVTALGDLVEAGLPNITGMIPEAHGGTTPPNPEGAFTRRDTTWSAKVGSGSSDSWGAYYDFDASLSNSIYDNSSTVQPQSIKTLYYICIATSTKTDIQVDIDDVMTDLAGKADTDLSNCTGLETVHVVIDTYRNGTNWYRIYDDGWVEQGGVILVHGSQTINLLKQYIDTNYCVYLSEASATTSALDVTRNSQVMRGTLTVSSFTCYINNNNNVIAFWYACGMGA